jgi:uncharacterized protein YfiM (DUF2279 family)
MFAVQFFLPALLRQTITPVPRSSFLHYCLAFASLFAYTRTTAQTDTLQLPVERNAMVDTLYATNAVIDTTDTLKIAGASLCKQLLLPYNIKHKRTWTVGGLHTGLYVGSMLLLNQVWYADYPKDKFHTFDDWHEWLQVDKVGHAWSAYQLSRASMASWRWAGMPYKKQVWLGGISGFAFQTVIEILDGFSAEWGWSWGDFAANCVGSGLLIGQELGWHEQRINFKFSFHKMTYDDPMLNERSDDLFGSSLPERMLKDYNGQTYWLSFNLHSFMKQSKLPIWLNLAVGYGATGMFGGTENIWTDEATGITYNRNDIDRQRQWYIAPDIDFTRIPTRSKFLRSVFFCLNAFKLPAPTLVFSNGGIKVHGFYF